MTAFEYETQVIKLMDYAKYSALQYTRDTYKAEDLAQETMLKALSNFDKFQTNTNLKGWIKVILRNTFINEYRKKINQVISYDSEDYNTIHGLPDTYLPDNVLSTQELNKTIDDLDESLNKPLRLFMAGYKYHEIAEEMNITLGTVKSRIHQARKILSQKINRF